MKGSAHVLLDEGSGKIWTCSCWEKGNFIMINEFKYGQTWKIWPSPLSLWLHITFNSLKIKNWFSYKNPNDSKFFLVYKFICASCSSSYMAELVIILKLGLWSISKQVTSLIFLNIYTPSQHALTLIILFVLKWLIQLTLNSTQKLKKLYILIGESLT